MSTEPSGTTLCSWTASESSEFLALLIRELFGTDILSKHSVYSLVGRVNSTLTFLSGTIWLAFIISILNLFCLLWCVKVVLVFCVNSDVQVCPHYSSCGVWPLAQTLKQTPPKHADSYSHTKPKQFPLLSVLLAFLSVHEAPQEMVFLHKVCMYRTTLPTVLSGEITYI